MKEHLIYAKQIKADNTRVQQVYRIEQVTVNSDPQPKLVLHYSLPCLTMVSSTRPANVLQLVVLSSEARPVECLRTGMKRLDLNLMEGQMFS